jgi:hypothetical protein
MNNRDHISESLETIFWVKIQKCFGVDPGSGMEKNKHMRKPLTSPALVCPTLKEEL